MADEQTQLVPIPHNSLVVAAKELEIKADRIEKRASRIAVSALATGGLGLLGCCVLGIGAFVANSILFPVCAGGMVVMGVGAVLAARSERRATKARIESNSLREQRLERMKNAAVDVLNGIEPDTLDPGLEVPVSVPEESLKILRIEKMDMTESRTADGQVVTTRITAKLYEASVGPDNSLVRGELVDWMGGGNSLVRDISGPAGNPQGSSYDFSLSSLTNELPVSTQALIPFPSLLPPCPAPKITAQCPADLQAARETYNCRPVRVEALVINEEAIAPKAKRPRRDVQCRSSSSGYQIDTD